MVQNPIVNQKSKMTERSNGIIKTECIYPQKILLSFEEEQAIVEKYIRFYNDRRPHMSIGYQTPSVVHIEQDLCKKCGKTKFTKKRLVLLLQNLYFCKKI